MSETLNFPFLPVCLAREGGPALPRSAQSPCLPPSPLLTLALSEPIKIPEYEPDLISASQRPGTPPVRLDRWETLSSKFITILETISSIWGEQGESFSGVSQPRVAADPIDGGSQGHVWFQEHFEEVLALLGDAQVPRDGDAFLLLVQHLGDVGVVEGQVGTEQDVEEDAHAPDITLAAVVGFSLQHLGRRVGCAAAEGPAQLPVVPGEPLGEAKIRQLQSVALQQGVLALEVAVGHPAAVAVLDGLDQLAEKRPGARLGQGTLTEHIVKDVPMLRQLHHEADLPLCGLQRLMHADDVPVVQACDDLELPGQESVNKLCRETREGLLVGTSPSHRLPAPLWDAAEGGTVVLGVPGAYGQAPFPESCSSQGDAGLHQHFAFLAVGGRPPKHVLILWATVPGLFSRTPPALPPPTPSALGWQVWETSWQLKAPAEGQCLSLELFQGHLLPSGISFLSIILIATFFPCFLEKASFTLE